VFLILLNCIADDIFTIHVGMISLTVGIVLSVYFVPRLGGCSIRLVAMNTDTRQQVS
jgi:hypothetical protein